MTRSNPTDIIDVRFNEYVKERKTVTDVHMEKGVPNYAFGNDYSLQRKIKAIPGAFPLAKSIANYVVPLYKQMLNLESLKAGPKQFPDIYRMVVDCSRTLGIGIPTTFIKNDTEMNAYAYATEDDAPLIVLTSGLVERLTPGEVKYVIGHECGHIHNNHVTFKIAADLILTTGMLGGVIALPGLIPMLQLATLPMRFAFRAWSRAAEITADRAGVICSDNMEDVISATAKFMYGGTFNRNEIDLDTLYKQYERMRETSVRLLEIDSTHPASTRRIFAAKEFMNSDILYKWRPEWKQPGINFLSKQELDLRCNKIISVTKRKKKRGR
jgi:Zn-dependent protease with chaperone function